MHRWTLFQPFKKNRIRNIHFLSAFISTPKTKCPRQMNNRNETEFINKVFDEVFQRMKDEEEEEEDGTQRG